MKFRSCEKCSHRPSSCEVLGDAWEGEAKGRFDELYAELSTSVAALIASADDLSLMITTARANYAASAAANTAIWTGTEQDGLKVTPLTYDSAAGTFREKVLAVTGAHNDASGVLGGCGTMGGDDPSGRKWASVYDKTAKVVIGNLGIVIDQIRDFGALVELTGLNHAAADEASQITGASKPPAIPAPLPGTALSGLPSAVGGTVGAEPDGWEWIRDLGGFVWPNADTARMKQAGEAWSSLSTELAKVAGALESTVTELCGANRSAESTGVADTWAQLEAQIEQVSTDCGDLGGSCTDYAAGVDDAHNELVNTVLQTVALEVITAAVGLGLTPFTFGISDAGAAALMSGEVAWAVARAKRAFDALSSAADVAELALDAVQTIEYLLEPGEAGAPAGVAGTVATPVAVAVTPIIKTGLSASGSDLIDDTFSARNGLDDWSSKFTADELHDMWDAYVERKKGEGKTARDYDDWLKARNHWYNVKVQGARFEDERIKKLDKTPGVDGWQRDKPIKTPDTNKVRKPDLFNEDLTTAYEFKSGRGGEIAAKQLKKDEELVKHGWIVTWVVTDKLEPKYLKELQDLAAKYPGQFNYEIV